jgi:hypothetical protein
MSFAIRGALRTGHRIWASYAKTALIKSLNDRRLMVLAYYLSACESQCPCDISSSTTLASIISPIIVTADPIYQSKHKLQNPSCWHFWESHHCIKATYHVADIILIFIVTQRCWFPGRGKIIHIFNLHQTKIEINGILKFLSQF